VSLWESIHPTGEGVSGSLRLVEFATDLSSSIDDVTVIFDSFVSDSLGKRGLNSWIVRIHKVVL
jgi:hypothetical protein